MKQYLISVLGVVFHAAAGIGFYYLIGIKESLTVYLTFWLILGIAVDTRQACRLIEKHTDNE